MVSEYQYIYGMVNNIFYNTMYTDNRTITGRFDLAYDLTWAGTCTCARAFAEENCCNCQQRLTVLFAFRLIVFM